MKQLTCYLDLGGLAGSAGQHLELLCLVHGVVSAGHHQPVPRCPGAHIICQVQDRAVHVGVNSHRQLRFHWKPKMQGWAIQSISSQKPCSFLFSSPHNPLLQCHQKLLFSHVKKKKKVYSFKHVFYRLWLGKQENRKVFFFSCRQVDFPLTPG